MKMGKKLLAGICVLALSASFSACEDLSSLFTRERPEESSPITTCEESSPTATNEDLSDMMNLSVFYCAYDLTELTDDNEIKELIEQNTGVHLEEDWFTNDHTYVYDTVQGMIDSDSLPDMIYAGDGSYNLWEAGKLIAWDEYLDKYPNIKALYSDEEWDLFRQADGKIYWANQFGSYNEKHTDTDTDGYAFWIQARVLEAYDYPVIETLDEYFDILERYSQDYPTMPDGSNVIPYTCLCEDWYIYCLEDAALLLDGNPVDGCIVNVDNGLSHPQVIDFHTTPTAEIYFRKLNEVYNNGLMDPDFATMTHDEYIAKLSTGCVLGFTDQHWNFAYSVADSFAIERQASDGTTYRLDELGCEYVPLGLTVETGMEQQYFVCQSSFSTYAGIAITTACQNPDAAFAYLNDLLSQKIHDLRFWGIEGVDYLVDEETGLFYRTEEMRTNWNDAEYLSSHACQYQYMLQMSGMSHDGINRMLPQEQPSEYIATLSEPLQNCLRAYGADNFVEFLGSVECEPYPWFPVVDTYFYNTLQGEPQDAYADSRAVMHEWLPIVITSADFDTAWSQYTDAYNATNPQIYFDDVQAYLDSKVDYLTEYYGWEG